MERVAAVLAQALAAQGHRSTLVVLGEAGVVSDAAARAGVDVRVLGLPSEVPRSARDVVAAARGLLLLGRIVVGGRYDVVQTHLFRSGLLATPLGRLAGSVVVGGLHGLDANLTQRSRMPGLVRRQDAAACSSGGLREELVARHGFPAGRLVVVPNGLAVDGPLAAHLGNGGAPVRVVAAPGTVVIGCLGRLFPRKGQRRLIESFATIADTVPHAHLLLIGDGPDRPALEAAVRAAALAGRVHFAGEQADPGPWLAGCDLLAVPSDFEGFGLSVLEAQLAGVPVVSCAPGGPQDLVEDGVSGRQVAPEELATALLAAVTDPSARARWARVAADRAGEHTADRMARGYVEVYRRLLSSRGGRRGRPGRVGATT